MQSVDNLTVLSGAVLARAPHPTLPAHDLVTLAVDRAEPVPGRADLLGAEAGRTLAIAVRRDLLGDAGATGRLTLRAKQTPNGAIAESDPAPGDFVRSP